MERRLLKDGTILKKRYLLCGQMAQGGYGLVYRGKDTESGEEVVIKEFFPAGKAYMESGENDINYQGESFNSYHELYQNEVEILKKVKICVGCVKIRDNFEENGTFYIVTDLVEGKTLQEELDDGMTKNRLIPFIYQISYTLSRLDQLDILHRDICPENVIVQGLEKCTLVDFGSALDLSKENSRLVTEPTYRRGFSPPEQMHYPGILDRSVDLFSASAILYYKLTGKHIPDSGEDYEQEIWRELVHSGKDYKRYAVLAKGLSKNPEERHHVSHELLSGLFSDFLDIFLDPEIMDFLSEEDELDEQTGNMEKDRDDQNKE